MRIFCLHCGSILVAPSSRREWHDGLFRIIGRKPYRCQTCSTRFFAGPGTSEATPAQDAPQPPPTGEAA